MRRLSQAHDHNRYRQGCRCIDCRTAWLAYTKAHVARRRAAGVCARCSAPSDGYHCDRHLQLFREARLRHKRERVGL